MRNRKHADFGCSKIGIPHSQFRIPHCARKRPGTLAGAVDRSITDCKLAQKPEAGRYIGWLVPIELDVLP